MTSCIVLLSDSHEPMAEQTPMPQLDERFTDIYASRFLQPGHEIQMPGDPETPQDFARAQSYLEAITAHLIEFGQVWDKQPHEVAYELDYQNCWHQYEVELEKKSGEENAQYREITLQNLSALSKRRILAFEETGWEVTHDYRVVQHLDRLIEQALLDQEQYEALMAVSDPENTTPIQSSPNLSDDVPF